MLNSLEQLDSESLSGQVTFGRLWENDKAWVIDAKPEVMVRARPLFPGARGLYDRGKFTHCQLELQKTPVSAKDLLWLLQRYPMHLEPDLLSVLRGNADRYDRRVRAASRGDQGRAFDVAFGALG